MVLFLITRTYLAYENRRRNAEVRDTKYDHVYITEEKADGSKEEVKVDKVRLLIAPA